MSTQVTYEIDYIPVFRDSTISSALYFLCALYDNLKEKDYIKRNKNSKKQMFMSEISITVTLVCRKLESFWPGQQQN